MGHVKLSPIPAADPSYDLQANPASYEPVYNINYKNSQLWADDNNGMVVGEESIASSFSNIDFDNIDVIYNNDDYYYPDVLTDRAAIEVFQLNATQMSGITFNNIRVDQAKRLINVDIDNNFFLNTLRVNQGWKDRLAESPSPTSRRPRPGPTRSACMAGMPVTRCPISL